MESSLSVYENLATMMKNLGLQFWTEKSRDVCFTCIKTRAARCTLVQLLWVFCTQPFMCINHTKLFYLRSADFCEKCRKFICSVSSNGYPLSLLPCNHFGRSNNCTPRKTLFLEQCHAKKGINILK